MMGDILETISKNVGDLVESHRKGMSMEQDISVLKLQEKGSLEYKRLVKVVVARRLSENTSDFPTSNHGDIVVSPNHCEIYLLLKEGDVMLGEWHLV